MLVRPCARSAAATPARWWRSSTPGREEITEGLIEGGLDLGLLNVLPGDDVSPDLQSTALLHGRPVVCSAATTGSPS